MCLIVNPRSFRASRGGLAERAIELARRHDVDVIEAQNPAALSAALDRRLVAGPRRDLVVLAGDGTVQALIDLLVRLPGDLPMPRLLVLGGGRTNLTAADLDGTGDLLAKLEAAFTARRGPMQMRRVLVVEQPPAPARHGFFLAGGLVDETIRACHAWRARGSALRRGHLGTMFYLLMLGIGALLGRPQVRSPRLRVTAEGRGTLEGPMRLLVATTLEHRGGSFDPYAQRATPAGGPRFTAVIKGARRFWRSLGNLLRGRFGAHMTPEGGYLSGGSERIEVWGLNGYTLDGEEFDCDPSRPVLIRGGARFEFLQP
ncbi:MAG: diacylglycerol kinase, catalytic region [Panacagrimonas sp.]|nr:diacylglycerol kinase family protein [Panacagrimonas sp.]MCC2657154.1 diacylglycerol kinase, catalytic region [Panacagrimonas sp.]